jgi:hypothetical protein
MQKRQPLKDSRFAKVNRKATDKRAEVDRHTRAKSWATVCPICKEEFADSTERDLHMLDKHLGATKKEK